MELRRGWTNLIGLQDRGMKLLPSHLSHRLRPTSTSRRYTASTRLKWHRLSVISILLSQAKVRSHLCLEHPVEILSWHYKVWKHSTNKEDKSRTYSLTRPTKLDFKVLYMSVVERLELRWFRLLHAHLLVNTNLLWQVSKVARSKITCTQADCPNLSRPIGLGKDVCLTCHPPHVNLSCRSSGLQIRI